MRPTIKVEVDGVSAEAVLAALAQQRPELSVFAVRLGLYAAAFLLAQLWRRVGETQAALAIGALVLLAGTLLPRRDDVDVAVLALVVLAVASALVAAEVLSVWRGMSSYALPTAADAGGEPAAATLDRANGWAAAAWARMPGWLTQRLSLPMIGRARVPMWLWPYSAVVALATLDLARTLDGSVRGVIAATASASGIGHNLTPDSM